MCKLFNCIFCINGSIKETKTLCGVISKCRTKNIRYCIVVNVFSWVVCVTTKNYKKLQQDICPLVHFVSNTFTQQKFYISIECRMNTGCLT